MMKKNLVRICIVMIIVSFFSFSDWSFAEDSQTLKIIWEMLTLLVSMLSWIWVFFAKWAWEFLTNEWVYWETIWLDAILWQYRNIIKNIANFGLWFYFIYQILRWVIDDAVKIKDKLVWLLVAWVWIQASWFMTAVVIDISTITLSAVWSFPSVIISNSSELQGSFENTLWNFMGKGKDLGNEIDKWMKFSLFLPDMGQANFIKLTKEVPLEGTISKKDFYDEVMPKAENVSGPLYYLWLAILKTTAIVSPKSVNDQWWKSTILNILLQWWTTIIFCIEMLVLLIVAIMRMIYLRVFIVLSPLVLLLRCIEMADSKWWWSKWFMEEYTKGFKKHFNFSSFFWNVFKPTIIVLWFSLSMIFVTLISDKIISNKGQNFEMGWFTVYGHKTGWTDATWDWDLKYTTSINGEGAGIIIRESWKSLFELILSIITVFLVYIVLKIAVNMWWWDFASEKIKKMQNTFTEYMTKLPVMPVSWYDKEWHKQTRRLSAGKVFGINKDGRVNINDSIIWQKIDQYSWKIKDENYAHNEILRSWFWDKTWNLSSSETDKIKSAMSTGTTWWNKLQNAKKTITDIRKDKDNANWKWMTLNPNTSSNNGFWIQEFTNWLNNTKVEEVSDESWKQMIVDWKELDESKRSLKNLFTWERGKNHVIAYVKFFFENGDSRRKIETWDELQKVDISQKEEKQE